MLLDIDSTGENIEISDKELILAAKNKDKVALTMILERYRWLVQNIINKFLYSMDRRHHLFDDLFQEGNIGLIEAVARFDIDSSYAFSTYASFWIRKKVNACLKAESLCYGMSSVTRDRIYDFNKRIVGFLKAEERMPSIQELVDITGFSKASVLSYLNFRIEPERVDRLVGNSDLTLGETIDSGIDIEAEFFESETDEILRLVVNQLAGNDDNLLIISHVLELYDCKKISYSKIAKMLGISESAVSERARRVIKRLGTDPRVKAYKDNL